VHFQDKSAALILCFLILVTEREVIVPFLLYL
jgi:hypothetical protein